MIWYWIFLILGLLLANMAGMASMELHEIAPIKSFILVWVFNTAALYLVGIAFKVKLNNRFEELNNRNSDD